MVHSKTIEAANVKVMIIEATLASAKSEAALDTLCSHQVSRLLVKTKMWSFVRLCCWREPGNVCQCLGTVSHACLT